MEIHSDLTQLTVSLKLQEISVSK